ncbi:hypothetical protein WMF39_38370 [Sorangium sp. So ce1504]|uniref:hypothetical protein n=1 Tax=Sorangium sp. So ce1504 TaxID=3133337 RepID=UPI003F5F452A
MRIAEIRRLLLLMPLAAAGCGIDLGPYEDDQPSAPCGGATSCAPAAPPESVCRAYLTADQAEDGCGVFVDVFVGDDENPGTRDKPVQSLPRGIALARTGRGRVFLCSRHSGAITLPSGVDLVGSFDCTNDWKRRNPSDDPFISSFPVGVALTIEPARSGDTGAADGVSTLVNLRIGTTEDVGLFVRSGSAVEIVRSELFGGHGYRTGEDARTVPDPPEGARGNGGVQGCSLAPAAGGVPARTSCDDGAVTIGGKGGDGGATGGGNGGDGGDGGDGVPAPGPDASPDDRRWGAGGTGDHGDGRCQDGQPGKDGAQGADGAPGQGIGRLSENGWLGDRAGDGARGAPGQGGGGGGGLRGSAAFCGVASRSGPSGGSGGGGGCGGKGGTGGGNGIPSIAILALHAKVTVRDSRIGTGPAMPGTDGGEPQEGSRGGRGGVGAYSPDEIVRACDGGDGGFGGRGGYGGGGRGGDSIGIAYLDEDQLVLENVTFELGEPGEGGIGNPADPATWGEDGIAVETSRFPE